MYGVKELTLDQNQNCYRYRGWLIEGIGGFCTIRRYEATNPVNDKWLWAFKLRDVARLINDHEEGREIPALHSRPLYR